MRLRRAWAPTAAHYVFAFGHLALGGFTVFGRFVLGLDSQKLVVLFIHLVQHLVCEILLFFFELHYSVLLGNDKYFSVQ